MKILKSFQIVILMTVVVFGISCQKESVHEIAEKSVKSTPSSPKFKTGYFLIDLPESGYEDYFTTTPNGTLTEHYLEVGNPDDSIPMVGTLFFEMDEDFKITKLGCSEELAENLGIPVGLLNNHQLTSSILSLLETTLEGVDPAARADRTLWEWIKYIFWGEPTNTPCSFGGSICYVHHWSGIDHGHEVCPCP